MAPYVGEKIFVWQKLPREMSDRELLALSASNTRSPMLMNEEQAAEMISGQAPLHLHGKDRVFGGLGQITNHDDDDSDDDKDEDSDESSSEKKKQEKKERESRDAQIFNNEVAIAETTLEQVKDLLRQVATDKKLDEDGEISWEATYGDLELPNGESLKVPETGDVAAALQKQLQTIRSRTLQSIGQKRRKRNKFLTGADPKDPKPDPNNPTPSTGDPDLENIIGG